MLFELLMFAIGRLGAGAELRVEGGEEGREEGRRKNEE
jgi:hypothetical protein